MGFLDRLLGRGKKAAGDLMGDASMQREGAAQEREGAAEDRRGPPGAREHLRDHGGAASGRPTAFRPTSLLPFVGS